MKRPQSNHLNQQQSILESAPPKPTRGQRLADAMASKVGSWAFIGTQSVILAGWIGANSIPGAPHWDESPFILLNLVFSFASAYTAPVVLMSQNRQSEEDRYSAMMNHKVNLHVAQEIERLHQKIDDLQTRQLTELSQLLEKQPEAMSTQRDRLPSKIYLVAQANQNGVAKDNRKPKTVSVLLPQSVFNAQTTDTVLPSHLQTKQKFEVSIDNCAIANSLNRTVIKNGDRQHS
ncbi:DUF1003 domain-containing protein [Leptolyngbya sp. NIES-2104]|uniref:DUF1003 domain-containing protein n=1 Tax=Leptolyngbya sp. NIES-2104 TaxID=1552121 RepID=UPI0006EC6261|nr:DUF1003 domain-containing protein [Leptolyngbya sp. NIES-2104]GAP98949.1 predicted membrane protein [Leptolyngbya sp. NIES-2104]